MKELPQDWEKRFDERFENMFFREAMTSVDDNTPVKDFIRELLVNERIEDRNNVAEILKAMAVPAQNCKNIMVVPLNHVLDSITNN